MTGLVCTFGATSFGLISVPGDSCAGCQRTNSRWGTWQCVTSGSWLWRARLHARNADEGGTPSNNSSLPRSPCRTSHTCWQGLRPAMPLREALRASRLGVPVSHPPGPCYGLASEIRDPVLVAARTPGTCRCSPVGWSILGGVLPMLVSVASARHRAASSIWLFSPRARARGRRPWKAKADHRIENRSAMNQVVGTTPMLLARATNSGLLSTKLGVGSTKSGAASIKSARVSSTFGVVSTTVGPIGPEHN